MLNIFRVTRRELELFMYCFVLSFATSLKWSNAMVME